MQTRRYRRARQARALTTPLISILGASSDDYAFSDEFAYPPRSLLLFSVGLNRRNPSSPPTDEVVSSGAKNSFSSAHVILLSSPSVQFHSDLGERLRKRLEIHTSCFWSHAINVCRTKSLRHCGTGAVPKIATGST